MRNFDDKSKHLNCENRRLEEKAEISKDPNDVCGCIIAWYSFSISKDKVDQVISVVLNMLAMKDSFSLVLVFFYLVWIWKLMTSSCVWTGFTKHKFFNMWWSKVLILKLGQLIVPYKKNFYGKINKFQTTVSDF